MSRKHRVEFPGAIYHVFQRGKLIKSGSRKRHLTNIKIQFIRTAIDNKYSFKVIGDFIGVSQSAISRFLLDKGYTNYILNIQSS